MQVSTAYNQEAVETASFFSSGQILDISLVNILNHAASTTSEMTQGSEASGYVAPSKAMHMDAIIDEFFQYIMVL